MVVDLEGALWPWETIEAARAARGAASSTGSWWRWTRRRPRGEDADECGIVVAGVARAGAPQDWRAVVMEDGSMRAASPQAWAERAVALFRAWRADRLVAEVNQGGDMVEAVIRGIDAMVPFAAVRATRGKVKRAEPVAALYEQGRVRHRAAFPELERQMAAMTLDGFAGRGSPDRVDALVWAITELMIEPAVKRRGPPRVRGL